MTFWGLVQIFFDLILLAATGFMWMRLNRPAKDDPRLSRGLQLLQSKIAVLEDLSDRTETQVGQLTALMEQKIRDIQAKLLLADKHIQKIDSATSKSLEVAKIFQDKIPHQEIIERQNTIKYVKAARLAHQGVSFDEIASQVDLSRGEIEFIAKVNREQLQFSEEDLPEWAKNSASLDSANSEDAVAAPFPSLSVQAAPIPPGAPPQMTPATEKTLSDLGAQFRQAFVEPTAALSDSPEAGAPPANSMSSPISVTAPIKAFTPPPIQRPTPPEPQGPVVKKVIFPRIDSMR